MKIEKLDHVHIYVKDIDAAMKSFQTLTGSEFRDWGGRKVQDFTREFGCVAAFHPLGLELVQVTDQTQSKASTVGGKGGLPDETWREGVACLSFRVESLADSLAELEAAGWQIVFYSEVGKMKDATVRFPGIDQLLIELTQYEGASVPEATEQANDEAGHAEGSLRSVSERAS